ncbi:pyridoxine kinase [Rhizobium sp. RU20A]|nr:pyridoxine kinase [Rhizobium sp. RU20A]
MVFAFQTLGLPVWALPTVVLPWHPGHGRSTRSVLQAEDLAAMADDIAASAFADEIGTVVCGYFGSADQVAVMADLIERLKRRNPALLHVCDPVIGDHGGIYVSDATAEAIRDRLLPLADLTTPNRFELSWLCGADLRDNNEIMEAALALGPARVLVTSAYSMLNGGTGNLFLSGSHALLAEHRHIEDAPKGTGDLLTALFTARLTEGHSEERCLQLATAAVFEIIARSARRSASEMMLEEDATSLVSPMALVQIRHLLHPVNRRGR